MWSCKDAKTNIKIIIRSSCFKKTKLIFQINNVNDKPEILDQMYIEIQEVIKKYQQ